MLKVNGKNVEVRDGDTILAAARRAGIYIPTLCHHPRLEPIGACRMCIVQVEGRRGLVSSCTTPAEDGMVVSTDNDLIHATRRMLLQLLLAESEHNCLVCPANGECELQELCLRYKVDPLENPFCLPRERKEIDDSSPAIRRDPNKCVKCYRCVRACNDTVVNEVLDIGRRGFDSKIICDNDLPMRQSSCVSCGECVSVCPTGALTEKLPDFVGHSWELKKVRTTCPYCGVGCQIQLNVKGGKVVKVTSSHTVPGPNIGSLCVKGRFGYGFIQHPDRLRTPLIKENGTFREASWDEAIGLVAGRFAKIKADHGPDALAAFASARGTNEETYAVNRMVRAALGTNNLDHCARL